MRRLRAWLWHRGFYARTYLGWHPDATRALQEQIDNANNRWEFRDNTFVPPTKGKG